MTIREIQALVSKGEGNTLEFKHKVEHPEKIVREIVAFANSQGGNLLIGVDDDGTISGLKDAEEEAYALESAIQKHCKPPVPLASEIVPISKKRSVIHYSILPSQRKPHAVKKDESTKVYVRARDRSIQASKEMREILRRQRNPRDTRFTFGEKEKLLMQYLDIHGEITLPEFAALAQIKKYYASKTLIVLVLAKILTIEPREGTDLYKLADPDDEK